MGLICSKCFSQNKKNNFHVKFYRQDEELTIKEVKDEEENEVIGPIKLSELRLKDLIDQIYDEVDKTANEVNLNNNQVQPEPNINKEEEKKVQPLEKEEIELGNKLKQICDGQGTEINQAKSSVLLHKLALNYSKRSPDKLSLLKSAALYNAALIRSPKSKKDIIKKDLHKLCCHILQLAEAKQTNANLLEKSSDIKLQINKMRNKVTKKLKAVDNESQENSIKDQEIKKINDIKGIQNEIYFDYLQIMKNLAAYCNQLMKKAPCRYSIAGMGSLARKEITPYSDFEHIILLEEIDDEQNYESTIEHFRWYSVIFQIIVINLQETILPSVDISCLKYSPSDDKYWFYDAVTPRGISFDGLLPHACKMPLGRQEFTPKKHFKTELIKPVSKMLHYLDQKENLKNGYHLADILTKVCYVYGDNEIFTAFETKLSEILEAKSSDEIIKDIKNQLKDDLQNYAAKQILAKLKPNISFNIKKVVYRSATLFISALGRIYNISKNSCFDIIKNLREINKISITAKHKLEYAIAIACEIRLRWYMICGKQNDDIKCNSNSESTIKIFLSLVGLSSTIRYFQISYSLQSDISKRFNLKKLHFHSHPELFNQILSFCLIGEHQSNFYISSQTSIDERLLGFDECLSRLEQNFHFKTKSIKHASYSKYSDSNLQIARNYKVLGLKYQKQCNWDDAIDCFEISVSIINELNYLEFSEYDISEQQFQLNDILSDCYKAIGYCLHHSYKFDEAINKYKRATLICKSLSQNKKCYRRIMVHLVLIGVSYDNMKMQFEATKYFEFSLQIIEKIKNSIVDDHEISKILGRMGNCYLKMNRKQEGEKCLQRSIQIMKQLSSNTNSKNNFHSINYFFNFGEQLYNFNKPAQALEYFKQYLNAKEKALINKETEIERSVSLFYIGRCLFDLQNPQEALQYFHECLKIKEKFSLSKDSDIDISFTLYYVGRCLYDAKKFDEAQIYFKKGLEIKERVSLNKETDTGIAMSLFYIGRCLYNLQQTNEALDYLKRSLKIRERDSDKQLRVRNFEVLDFIGRCLFDVQEYDEALEYFHKCERMKEKVSRVKQANILESIGLCLFECVKPYEASVYFKKSLQIKKELSLKQKFNINIYDSYFYIGRCLYDIQKPAEALEYFQLCKESNEPTSIKDISYHIDLCNSTYI